MPATVIQFEPRNRLQPPPAMPPQRVRGVMPADEAAAENERLKRALDGLAEALAAQRAAIASWRASLAQLSIVVGGMGGSMRECQDALDKMQGYNRALRDEATQLVAWSDRLASD